LQICTSISQPPLSAILYSFMIVCHKAAPVLPSVVGGDSAVSLLGSAMVSVGFFGT
jgi:hypothetical protein